MCCDGTSSQISVEMNVDREGVDVSAHKQSILDRISYIYIYASMLNL